MAALEAIHAGELVVSQPPARARPARGSDWPGRGEGLTEREAEILALITQGKSNVEGAALTYLSPNTVKSYIRSSYQKINVASRTQAVLWGVANGFTTDHHRIDHWRGAPEHADLQHQRERRLEAYVDYGVTASSRLADPSTSKMDVSSCDQTEPDTCGSSLEDRLTRNYSVPAQEDSVKVAIAAYPWP